LRIDGGDCKIFGYGLLVRMSPGDSFRPPYLFW